MDDTMRDILSKLDQLISETSLEDLKNLPGADDPIIAKAIADKEKEQAEEGEQQDEDLYQIGDEFGISFSEDFEIGAEIVDILEDGIVINLDYDAMEMLANEGISFIDIQLDEEKQKGVDGKACWKGYKRMGTKQKGGKTVDNCVKMGEDLDEAEYQGRKVQLGKPMKGDVKKSKVYVRGPKGNVVKVNFGDKKMRIKKSNPNRRKSFRARHNCSNPGPRWKARYWSCRAW